MYCECELMRGIGHRTKESPSISYSLSFGLALFLFVLWFESLSVDNVLKRQGWDKIHWSNSREGKKGGTGNPGERKSWWETGKGEREIQSGRRDVMRDPLLSATGAWSWHWPLFVFHHAHAHKQSHKQSKAPGHLDLGFSLHAWVSWHESQSLERPSILACQFEPEVSVGPLTHTHNYDEIMFSDESTSLNKKTDKVALI